MFRSKKQTSSFPFGWGKPPKKSHKKRNALIGVGLGSALIALLVPKKNDG